MKRRRRARLGKKWGAAISRRKAVLAGAVGLVALSGWYAANGGMGMLAVLGTGQLAVANEGDLECVPMFDYTCPFGTPKEKCPKKQKPGGQGKPCKDTTNGHTTPGKCVSELKCQGEPKGDGKGGGEMPKMPEPPKKEPPKEQPKQDQQQQQGCSPTMDFSGSFSTPEYNSITGERCPQQATSTPVGSVWYSTTSTSTATSTATTTSQTPVSRVWSAIVNTVQSGVESIGGLFSGYGGYNSLQTTNTNGQTTSNNTGTNVAPNVTSQVYVLNPKTGLLQKVNSTELYSAQIFNPGTNSTLGKATVEDVEPYNIFTATTTSQSFFDSTLEQLKGALLQLSNLLTGWI